MQYKNIGTSLCAGCDMKKSIGLLFATATFLMLGMTVFSSVSSAQEDLLWKDKDEKLSFVDDKDSKQGQGQQFNKGTLTGWCLSTTRKKNSSEESIWPARNESNGSCSCASGWRLVITGSHGIEINNTAPGKPDGAAEKFYSCVKK